MKVKKGLKPANGMSPWNVGWGRFEWRLPRLAVKPAGYGQSVAATLPKGAIGNHY